MSFRVSARTVLQLGAELISSDGVAFFELIKNAFDAGSGRVDIDVCVRLDQDDYVSHTSIARDDTSKARADLEAEKGRMLANVDTAAPGSGELVRMINQAATAGELSRSLEEANYIEISDQGHGMSATDLDEIYLTIGTPHRRLQRTHQTDPRALSNSSNDPLRPILGEKGLGRLSAMRLGWRLDVVSTTAGEQHWNRLEVDWRQFIDDNLMVEDVFAAPAVGPRKADYAVSGTRIRIYALSSSWSASKLSAIAAAEFSKLTDPFAPDVRYPINVRYNGVPVVIPHFNDILFKHAHASVEASYIADESGPRLAGTIRYTMHDREKTFRLDARDLVSITEPSPQSALQTIGPFTARFYWYNRRILSAIEGIGDQRAVRALVNDWAGGLKVYRDGFRVNPYGAPDDDWLDLDKGALASSGYKVNRHQIIGVVSISSRGNPNLLDQTNREGLRDCPEKDVLVRALRHMLATEFRDFLNQTDKEVKATLPASFEDLEERVEDQEQSIRRNLEVLLQRHPAVRKDRQLLDPIYASMRQIRLLMEEASRLAETYEAGHSELTHLAGLGLMVEIVAHELNRATAHSLRTIADARREQAHEDVDSLLKTLGAQLQTLQRRLRVIDPLSTAGRQRRERFELGSWVRHIVGAHSVQFSRHNVQLDIQVVSQTSSKAMQIYMVKGMFVQILENMLSNSMYWLKIEGLLDPTFRPRITITLNTNQRTLAFADNGPGIPVERREQVFQPFFTTKPPGEGHGLGLYVSREIAQYNDATLSLLNDESVHEGRLNTFLLELGEE